MNLVAARPGRWLASGIAAALVAAAFGWAVATVSVVPADARNGACVARTFKTEMVKDACARGGQAEAKKVMKRFMADAQVRVSKFKRKASDELACETCHTRLAPSYPLTEDGLALFKRLGGR